MQSILKYSHIVYLLYLLYGGWVVYEELQTKFEEVKQTIPVQKNKIKKNKKKLKQLNNYFKDIKEAKERIELVASEISKIQKKLPNSFSDTENLGAIKKIAEDLNIKNIYLTPMAEEDKGFYFTKKYEFKATGTYLQFLIFFEKISENERLLNINQISLSNTGSKQRGRFQLINTTALIEAYRYNNDYKEDTGIRELEEGFKNKKPGAMKKRRRKRNKKK
jgi:Tfp pilus assembly protein PilO